jgi:hypothetical protein
LKALTPFIVITFSHYRIDPKMLARSRYPFGSEAPPNWELGRDPALELPAHLRERIFASLLARLHAKCGRGEIAETSGVPGYEGFEPSLIRASLHAILIPTFSNQLHQLGRHLPAELRVLDNSPTGIDRKNRICALCIVKPDYYFDGSGFTANELELACAGERND